MAALLTGTVTFLFTDIEGSTALLQRLGDRRYAVIVAEHQRLLRDAFAKGNGHEIDTQGDAFLVAFPRARDALATAVAAQQAVMRHPWPDGASLRVRMGLHTGEPISRTGGYVGLDVHRAARICSAGHGGQVLLSHAVEVLAASDLPLGTSLRDLGTHRLKDLQQPEHLLQVVHPDLPTDFPPLKSLDARPNNLPIQLTSFIGREREIAEVKRLLGAARLVTLTGSGGAGKTRLALHLAADMLEEYPGGVWLAEFAPIADPALVPKTVASALGVPEQPGRDLAATLVDALGPKSVLLVLDNCEHLLAECADLAATLLRACPRVHILATSREALGIPGENLWTVPSLSLPNAGPVPTVEDLVLFEAARLFVDRARATVPDFPVTAKNASTVAQICRRLDGIPLAIELAAARVKVLTVEQIAARLDDRFQLLTGGSRHVLPHHQTLRATMDWSYGLLLEKEQAMLRRLSVFAGGWTLEAAETVCAGGEVKGSEVLDLLALLAGKSLVVVETHRVEAWYRLLETVRQYGGDRLSEAGEIDTVRGRHSDWYLAFAESVQPKLRGPEEVRWLERLDLEHDNLRAALERSTTTQGDPRAGLRLAVALHDFWDTRGYRSEGRAWLEELLTMDPDAPPELKVKGLNAVGVLAHRQGDYERVLALCGEALTLSEATGDHQGSALACHYLAHAAQVKGDHRRAVDLLERGAALCREAGDTHGVASMLNCLGDAMRSQGNYARAITLFDEVLALCAEQGTKRGKMPALHNLACAVLYQGDHRRAAELFREGLALASELRDLRNMMYAVAGLGGVYAESKPERSARLIGATEALLAGVGVRVEPVDRVDFDRWVTLARARLREDVFARATNEGRAMTLEQAIEYALAEQTG